MLYHHMSDYELLQHYEHFNVSRYWPTTPTSLALVMTKRKKRKLSGHTFLTVLAAAGVTTSCDYLTTNGTTL
jgi:hypothetical protein